MACHYYYRKKMWKHYLTNHRFNLKIVRGQSFLLEKEL